MADVTLTLKADTDQYVKDVRAAEKATQDLYDTAEKGAKREKGLIEDIEDEITKLTAAKKKAYTVEDIEKYNKKIEEAKRDLQEYEKAGVKANTNVEKTGNNLLKSIGRWAAGFVTVTAALAGIRAIINSTDALGDKFAATLNGWKEGFAAMARAIANNDFKDFFKNVRDAVEEGQRFTNTQNEIEDATRAARIEIAENNTKILDLRIAQQNANLTKEEQIELGKQAVELTKRNSQIELDLAEQTLANDIRLAASKAKTTEEVVRRFLEQDEALLKNIEIGKEYNRLQGLIDIANTTISTGTAGVTLVNKEATDALKKQQAELGGIGKSYSELAKNIENVLDPLKDKIVTDREAIEQAKQNARNLRIESALNADLAAQNKETDKDTVKSKEEYYNKLKQLQDAYDKSVIESLTGEAKLEAIRDFELKQLDLLKGELTALGEITPEMQTQIEILAANIHKAFAEAMAAAATLSDSDKEAVSNALLDSLPPLAGIQKSFIQQAGEDEFDFSLAEKLGLGDEDIETIKDGLSEITANITDALDSIFARRVEDAQRTREILEDQISETQSALDSEIALFEAGYASNVELKRKQLEQLKKQRDDALADEEKAIKRQQTFETLLQTVNLITASSEIFKTFSKIPIVGVPLAIAAIASMFAAFIAAKGQAQSATKLAEGGSGSDTGIVTGKRHSGGGERFLDHVEVERGEAWGVLSRPASEKYGRIFHDMVSSFNKDEMPKFMPISNNVLVENSGPNSRLDKVIKEQKRLNESILKQQKIYYPGKKVIQVGNKIRIVG